MKSPPEGIKRTMEAVCILLSQNKTDWSTAQKLLAKIDFLHLLKNYNKELINHKMIKKLKNILMIHY